MTDRKCPMPNCPEGGFGRRQDDGGTQMILSAIGEVHNRLGRIESFQAKTAERVGAHSGEIENLKAINKSKMDKKWILVSAFIGAATTLFASVLKVGK